MALDFSSDPYAAWGTLLGTAFGQLYNKNAQKREDAKADRIIKEFQNQQEVERIAAMRDALTDKDTSAGGVVAEKLAQQAGTQGAQQATGMNLGVLKGVDYLGQTDKYGQTQDNNYQLSVPSPLEQLRQEQVGGKDYSVNKALQANQQAVQANEAQQASMTPQQRVTANFNPKYTADNVREALEKADVRKDIIDKKLKTVNEDIKDRARAYYQPGILKDMYYGTDVADSEGNIIHVQPNAATMASALLKIQEYAKYDPEGAKTLASGIVGPQTFWQAGEEDRKYARNRADKLADTKQSRQWKKEDLQEKYTHENRQAAIKAIANAGKNNKITKDDYKLAMTRTGEIEAFYQEKVAENSNYKLPQSMQEEWEELTKIKKAYRKQRIDGQGTNNSGDNNNAGDGETERVDWNNWDSINAGINQALKDGYTSKEIIALAKDKLGEDHEWYKNIVSSFNHDSNSKANTQESDEEKRRRLDKILFPSGYNTNTTDQTIASIANLGSAIGNGTPLVNLAHR